MQHLAGRIRDSRRVHVSTLLALLALLPGSSVGGSEAPSAFEIVDTKELGLSGPFLRQESTNEMYLVVSSRIDLYSEEP